MSTIPKQARPWVALVAGLVAIPSAIQRQHIAKTNPVTSCIVDVQKEPDENIHRVLQDSFTRADAGEPLSYEGISQLLKDQTTLSAACLEPNLNPMARVIETNVNIKQDMSEGDQIGWATQSDVINVTATSLGYMDDKDDSNYDLLTALSVLAGMVGFVPFKDELDAFRANRRKKKSQDKAEL